MLPRVAVIIRRVGPYHVARLRALAPKVEELLVIEVCAVDATYSWELQLHNQSFKRRTLFAREADARVIGRLRARLTRVLLEFDPDVVAVPGWSEPAALIALDWAFAKQLPTVLMSDSQQSDKVRSPVKEVVKRHIVAMASAALAAGKTQVEYLVRLGMDRKRIAIGYDVGKSVV